jgi:hypothetical protein
MRLLNPTTFCVVKAEAPTLVDSVLPDTQAHLPLLGTVLLQGHKPVGAHHCSTWSVLALVTQLGE